MRIRVGLKVNDPLVDGFWLPFVAKEMRWIAFKCEKLHEFCFVCGKLGHLLKSYGEEVKMVVYDLFKMRFGD